MAALSFIDLESDGGERAGADQDKEGRPGGGGRRHPAIDVRLTQSLEPEAPLSSRERSQSGTHAVFRAGQAEPPVGGHIRQIADTCPEEHENWRGHANSVVDPAYAFVGSAGASRSS